MCLTPLPVHPSLPALIISPFLTIWQVVLGTVTDINEGARWLDYTYLAVRLRKNPLAYGLTWEQAIALANASSQNGCASRSGLSFLLGSSRRATCIPLALSLIARR